MPAYLRTQNFDAQPNQYQFTLDSPIANETQVLVFVNNIFIDTAVISVVYNKLNFDPSRITINEHDKVRVISLVNVITPGEEYQQQESGDLFQTGFVGNQIRNNTILGSNIANETIRINNLNTTDPEFAVVTRINVGPGMNMHSTGVIDGTGLVTLRVDIGDTISDLQQAFAEHLVINQAFENYVKSDSNVEFNGDKIFNGTLNVNQNIILGPNANLLISTQTKGDGRFYRGTVNPTNLQRLNYDGYFYATRVYNAVFNDLAECMPSDGSLSPGDIAIIDTSVNYFRLTRAYNDKRIINSNLVVGIVSENPGMVIGENDDYENKVYIALKGMVWVNIETLPIIDVNIMVEEDRLLERSQIIGQLLHIRTLNHFCFLNSERAQSQEYAYLGKIIDLDPENNRRVKVLV